MATYSVSVDLTLNFSLSIEANSEEEAIELAEQKAYKDYLVETPDGMDATVMHVVKD
jgi:hypothetical protein